jgi:hypothetical protein
MFHESVIDLFVVSKRRRNTAVRRLIALHAVLACLGAGMPHASAAEPAPSGVGDVSKAEELMRAATDLYTKGEFERARAMFLQVWALRQHPAVAAALGDVEMKLGLFAEAAEHWSYYLANLPAGRDPSEGRDALNECRKRVGSIRLIVDDGEADVYVDGLSLGRSLRREIWTVPGEHVVEVRSPDGRKASAHVVLAAGEEREVTLSLGPASASAAPSPPVAPPLPVHTPQVDQASPVRSGTDLRMPIVITGSLLTIAGVAVGVIYNGKASQDSDDVDRYEREIDAQTTSPHLLATKGGCSRTDGSAPSSCSALDDSVDAVVRNRNIRTGAFVGAGVIGVATLAAFFLWPQASKSASDKPSVGRIHVLPWNERGQGVRLGTSF